MRIVRRNILRSENHDLLKSVPVFSRRFWLLLSWVFLGIESVAYLSEHLTVLLSSLLPFFRQMESTSAKKRILCESLHPFSCYIRAKFLNFSSNFVLRCHDAAPPGLGFSDGAVLVRYFDFLNVARDAGVVYGKVTSGKKCGIMGVNASFLHLSFIVSLCQKLLWCELIRGRRKKRSAR